VYVSLPNAVISISKDSPGRTDDECARRSWCIVKERRGADKRFDLEEAQRRMSIGDFTRAVGVYKRVVNQSPANSSWKLNLGIALQMAVAAQAMPQAVPAHALLATSLMRLGQPGKAIGPLQRFAGAADAGGGVFQTGQPKLAVGQLAALTRLEPNDAGAWFVLGRADEAAAAQTFQALAKQFPESRAFLLTTALVRKKQQRLKAAAALEEQGRSRPPWARADALAREIETFSDGARWAFTQLGTLPDNPQLHKINAETLRAQGQHLEAVEEWRLALRFDPKDRDTERELAASLYAGSQYLEALNTLERLLVHDPESVALHFLKGDCLLQQGQTAEAIGALTKAVSYLPARASLGRALLAEGRGVEAVPHLEASAPELDTDGALYFQLSRAYQAAGSTDKAKAALEERQKRRQ